ncbi:MAG TPA: hypothetical protein VFQ44_23245 [Streptosporangiaceae bacterium]|nr:hypothetical protein [Streptosporangiaceae bacterium]
MRMPQSASGPAASVTAASDPAAADAAKSGSSRAPGHVASAENGSAASSNGSAASMNRAGSTATSPLKAGEAAKANGDPAKPAADPGKTTVAGAKAGQAGTIKAKASAWYALALATVRQHWIASALIAGGLILRVLTEIAYYPAIIYIDTLKYLYGAWPGSDPVAYKIPLKMILTSGGSLSTVELVQHLLGIGIAVAVYAVLVRRGVPRWLGAIAIAPVLFDAYQLQAEAMIMPDVWFEALVVLGLVVLLWQKRPTLQILVAGALLLGASTGIREIGEITIVPAVFLAVAVGGGWRKMAINTAAVACAFFFAIALYSGASYELTHHLRVSNSSESLTYGRMSSVVNCATLNVLPPERLLCPASAEQAMGPDWLDHSKRGPLRMLDSRLPPNLVPYRSEIVSHFNHAVEEQQPLRVAAGILRDSVKLFAIDRTTSPGDTPIGRWQFHGYYPNFGRYVFIKNNLLYITLPQQNPQPLATPYGNAPSVNVPVARFLRSYQTNGGYTPGPFLALCVLAGLIGSVLLFARRRLTDQARLLGLGCLAFFTAAIAILAMSDVFEFTWRYQLPAIVTLPPAGAFGLAMLLLIVKRRRETAPAQTVSERAPELTVRTP